MNNDDTTSRLTARFSEALAFTADLHRHQQRKGGEIPYVGHLLSVAGLVIEADGTETQVIAALLHDAVEDQGRDGETLREITTRFGADVARIVEECSDTDEIPKPPWRPRKEAYIRHLETVSPETILVSLADKLDNSRAILRDLRKDGPSLWDRFSTRDPQDHLWYYRALLAAYEERADSWLVAEFRLVVAEIAAEVRGAVA